MIRKAIFILFFILPLSSLAGEPFINIMWSDNRGEHALIMEKGSYKNNIGKYLLIKQISNSKIDWVLNDYVKDCDADIFLDVVKESIEIKNNNSVEGGTVLFAYKIGCVGGIDPVLVKYFAYHNGVKSSLKGEEHIIIGGDSYGGEIPPTPDYNLKHNKPLLDYMIGKWITISLRRY